MKISISWLKQLVDCKLSPQELAEQLSLKSIGVKEITPDYIELDLTYNRGDLLSLRGVAREVAAITGSTLKFQDSPKLDTNLPKTTVKIEDETLSPIQCSAKIEGLKIGPSSKDWVKKLTDSGMRSVNNIVDVTNLIMLEFGHPLHAFDAENVKDETIIVRVAKDGEELITLDNKLRKLDSTDIVLANSEKALDVGGVMGSKDTEVKQSTHTILLSASMFNPVMVRKTSKKLGLYSEASKRFQHGLTRANLLQAYYAAIKMYESLGGKLTAINLVGDFEEKPKTITLNHERLNQLIGIEIPREAVESSLKRLGFKVDNWEVTPPYWRLDINIEEDLIEEVARMYGYEKTPPQELRGKLPAKLDQSLPNFIYDLKVALKDAGLTEVQTYSFFSTDVLNILTYEKQGLVKIANPISTETEYLRNHIWPNLVEVVGKNIRKGYKDIAIFELGKAYYKIKSGYSEEYKLSIALLNGSENPTPELYQIFKNIVQYLKLGISVGGEIGDSAGRFHPTRYLYLNYKNNPVGKIGEVHPRVLDKFGIDKRVAIIELLLPQYL